MLDEIYLIISILLAGEILVKIECLRQSELLWKIVLSTDDEPNVSSLWLGKYQMRYGVSVLRVGGIGGVATDEVYRHQGFARRIMEESSTWMNSQDFDVAMLFGIPNFYHKFGYATVLPETWIDIEVQDVHNANLEYQIRTFEMANLPEILEIYHSNNADRVGTLIRNPDLWRRFNRGITWEQSANPFVVVDSNDQVTGYFFRGEDSNHVTVSEIGFLDQSIFPSILRFLANYANQVSVNQLRFSIPQDHPFSVFCRRFGTQTAVCHRRCGGGMMRLIRQTATLKKMCYELTRRLQKSAEFIKWQGIIEISTDLGTDLIKIDNGHVDHQENSTSKLRYKLEIAQNKLAQLMMGRRTVEDLVWDSNVSVSAEIIDLLDCLFPTHYPHVWWPDRF
ncbi:TPA: GNAT family N-acetyltransferase [Candidatus Poribacteria bacterium]|nr:GNAT family N-acetyltransferase [Candidatus Poribacteria bacterium]HIO08064.1 GNAT family N-acetyltransferase [Candidatus Poribacteria bacterium]